VVDRDTVDEIKRHFGVVVEGLESRIAAVAEGVDRLNERFDGQESRLGGLESRFERLESQMHAGFAELRSMIQASHAQTDRRLTALETA
jgi:hypothetical protein